MLGDAMATAVEGDAASTLSDAERVQDHAEGLASSGAPGAVDGASSGLHGREEATQSAGSAHTRRRRRRRRRRQSRGGEETKGDDGRRSDGNEYVEEDEDANEGTSSATGSVEQDRDPGGEQDQERDRGEQEHDDGGAPEQKVGSDEQEEDEPFPSSEPTLSSDRPEQMLAQANLRVETGGRQSKVLIQPDEDELLLRAVLSHEAQLTDDNAPKKPVWASIAAACGDRFASGASAAGKVLWLTRVWRDHRHDQHASLTGAMRTMVKQYLDFMGEDDSPRAMPKRKAKLSFTDPAAKRRARLREKQRQEQVLARQGEEKAREKGSGEAEEAVELVDEEGAESGSEGGVEEEVAENELEEEEELVEEEEKQEEHDKEPEEEVALQSSQKLAGKTKLDPALEEELLQAAMKYMPALAATSAKAPVWEDIAQDSNGRYKNGGSIRNHFVWLLKVADDPNEREHAKVTPKLRKMLERFEKVCFSTRRRDKRKARESKESRTAKPTKPAKSSVSAENKSRKRRKEGSERDELMVEVNEDDEFPPLPISKGKMTIDAELEEKLLVAIMKHLPAFEAAQAKTEVWDIVAQDSRGRYRSGSSARGHYMYLLRVMKDPSEREHDKLTPKLREMLTAIDRVGFKPKQSKPTQDAKRPRVAAPSSKETTVQPVRKPTNVRQSKSSATTVVDSDMDEALMEMQLKFRPFDYDPFKGRTVVWKQLVQALNHPRLATSNAASVRSNWLRMVLGNPDHDQHQSLTPKLRKLVTEYVDALEQSPTEKKTMKPSSASASDDEAQESEESDATSSVSEPMTRSRRRAQEEPAVTRTNKRVRTNDTRGEDAEPVATHEEVPVDEDDEAEETGLETTTPTPTTFEDHVLLIEILRDPPFLAKKRGGCNPRWGLVADAVRKQIGSKAVLTTGEACMRRMVKLLSAVRAPGGKSSVTVSTEQLEMLSLINTLTGFKNVWASFEKKKTEVYLSMKERTAAMLARPLPTQQAQQSITGTMTDGEEDDVAEADEDKEDRPPEENVIAQRSPQRESTRQKRRRTEEFSPPVERHNNPRVRSEHPSIVELLQHREPVPLGGNGSIAAQLTSLQVSVATCRAEITVQSSRLEKGRRHHHQELLAMFELLKQEHETHTAETAEMLERMEQERLERRDEFANMIQLVSQMLPPA